MKRISSVLDYLHSSIAPREDMDDLRRRIIKNSVRRKQEELELSVSGRRPARK